MPYKDKNQAKEYRRLRYLNKKQQIKKEQSIYRQNNKLNKKKYNIQYFKKNKIEICKLARKYRIDHKDEICQRKRELRIEVFSSYGGVFCSLCGENRIYALALDHINQDGAEKRRNGENDGEALYRNLRKK